MEKMKLLVIGGGGREHAITWALKKSHSVNDVFCAPGNAGMAKLATCYPTRTDDLAGQIDLAKKLKPDLVVIGPEAPLVAGLSDELRREGIKVFGPSQKAAQIEGSKVFTKLLLDEFGIPTAGFQICESPKDAFRTIKNHPLPMVLKADGLASGKGVVVAFDLRQAFWAVEEIMVEKKFGEAGNRLIIEEYLEGRECSVIVLTDGENLIPFYPARDYKSLLSGNRGPNTGGMGSYAPLTDVPDDLTKDILARIIQPTINALAQKGFPYQGVLYAGLMLTKDGPKVLEYNCRFGDPEIQAILPLLVTDFAEMLLATTTSELANVAKGWYGKTAVCVVLTSEGYPDKHEIGFPIQGLEKINDPSVLVFHAGTALNEKGELVTAGGRVLNIVGIDKDQILARARAYEAVRKIYFQGMQYRQDIAL